MIPGPSPDAGGRAEARSTIAVSLWRGAGEGGYVRYEVPHRASQTVLDVVTYVQRHLDASLAYRFSCRVGVCGSCAMTVNGRPRWTCRTHVSKVIENGGIEIGPLANLPVIRDLAVDMAPLFDKWVRADGRFVPTRTRDDPVEIIAPASAARRAVDAAIECINCGVCHAACDTVRWNEDYLGPAALNRAWSLANDVRDGGQAERLHAVSREGGCHACHTHQSCEQHCPVGLNPTRSIAGLKRMTLAAFIRGGLE